MDEHKEHDRLTKETIQKDVDEYGCHLALIKSDGYLPSFVYSIGLFKNFGHPEIIVFGLKTGVMGNIINDLKDEIAKGKKFETGKEYSEILVDYPIQFLRMDKKNYPDYLGYAVWFYGNTFDFPVLQLIWPDKTSRWPWDDDFNEQIKYTQPLLDRNSNFKFYEAKNLGVFTTKHAFEGSPILYVYHDNDGDWQFITEHGAESEPILVYLEDIVKLDPSINDLHYLNYGESAHRKDLNADWIVETSEDEGNEHDQKR